MKKKIRLSQCMIVKNEEKNIRRALSWAKDIAFEQIVVDTGSTDRTVEIAEEMGAQVYHFQWINDFAAAKNYAIEQAKGDWIAFLDADEYFSSEDVKKLWTILGKLSAIRPISKIPQAVRCACLQLDDSGKVFSVAEQDRIFRNSSRIRYHGEVHEYLELPDGRSLSLCDATACLSILHTGYGHEAVERAGKIQRNIELLQKELEKNPKNYNAWAYMGDSYKAANDYENAKKSYRKVLNANKSEVEIWDSRYLNAGAQLLEILVRMEGKTASNEEVLEIVKKLGYPEAEHPDIYYYLALWLNDHGEKERAFKEMERALKYVDCYKTNDVVYTSGNLKNIYIWMTDLSRNLDRPEATVKYAVLALRMDRYLDGILAVLLGFLRQEPGEADQAEGTWGFLQNLYDFQSPKDLLFLLKCAKMAGFYALEERLVQAMPEELKREFQKPSGQEPEVREG